MIKAVLSKSERVGNKASICIEAPTIEEAQSQGSREAAIEHSKVLGMGRPGISGNPWLEWCDKEGKAIPQHEFQAAPYRVVHITWPTQEGL
jgi:hypothetical protein